MECCVAAIRTAFAGFTPVVVNTPNKPLTGLEQLKEFGWAQSEY